MLRKKVVMFELRKMRGHQKEIVIACLSVILMVYRRLSATLGIAVITKSLEEAVDTLVGNLGGIVVGGIAGWLVFGHHADILSVANSRRRS